MMRYKALTFKDTETAKLVMETSNPSEHKKLGRGVQNYNDAVWTRAAQDVVYQGNYLKYSQNPRLGKILLSTGDALIAEASSNDTRWGIGLDEDSPNIVNVSLWKGDNWLGEVLMRVRNKLKEEEAKK